MTLLWKTRLRRRPKRALSAFGILLLFSPFASACNVAPAGADSVPTAWSYESSHYTVLPSEDNWWQGFDDPVLTALIDMGERNSFNLSMAAHRIEMARQTLAITNAGYSPSIGLSA